MKIMPIHDESRFVKLETIVTHIDSSLDKIDKRFEIGNDRFNRLEDKLEKVQLNLGIKIEAVDNKLASFQKWIIGIGVSAFLSVGGEIVNIALKMNS